MSELRNILERAARQKEDPDAFDQLRKLRFVRQRRRRVGGIALALVIAAGGIGLAAVALPHRGTPVVPGTNTGTSQPSTSVPPPPRSTPTSSSPASALCSNTGMRVTVQGTQGAAGTIRWVWRAQNISGTACRSFGYPGMDVHGPGGWLDLRVHRGGFADINQAPQHIVVAPGHSMYFVSYWSDATTSSGSCTRFNQVKVTLPDNRVSNVVSATGCLSPASVDVGPVTSSLPGDLR